MVIEVLCEEATVNEITAKYGIQSAMLGRWKQEFIERASDVFKKWHSEAEKELKKEQQHVAELERKVGQLTYEVDWLKKNLKKSSNANDRKTLIEFGHKHITVKRQADLLEVNRRVYIRNIQSRQSVMKNYPSCVCLMRSIHMNRPGVIEPLRLFSGETWAVDQQETRTSNHEKYGHLCHISKTESE